MVHAVHLRDQMCIHQHSLFEVLEVSVGFPANPLPALLAQASVGFGWKGLVIQLQCCVSIAKLWAIMPTNALLLGCCRLDPFSVHDYVQLWIDCLLRIAYPVSEDTVVLLSKMAVSRLALDSLLQDWKSLSQCLNPYLACRKDAVGVSNIMMQSSIVTGSEIGPLVTVLEL
jgi:hypothetical protein